LVPDPDAAIPTLSVDGDSGTFIFNDALFELIKVKTYPNGW
jgi:hypothetical protein